MVYAKSSSKVAQPMYVAPHLPQIHARCILDAGFVSVTFTFHAGRLSASRSSNLSRKTGTLDGLRALLDPVLIAAAVERHDLTGTLLYLVLT